MYGPKSQYEPSNPLSGLSIYVTAELVLGDKSRWGDRNMYLHVVSSYRRDGEDVNGCKEQEQHVRSGLVVMAVLFLQ